METSLRKVTPIKKIALKAFLLIFCVGVGCLSNQKKGMASVSDSIVFFYIHKSPETPLFLEPETWLPIASSILNGVHFDEDEKTEFNRRWQNLFKYIGISDSLVGTKELVRLFSEDEVRKLADMLYKAEQEIPDGTPKGYQVILKREDPIRPGLRIRRTIFYIHNNANCLVLDFGEIGQVVDFQTTYTLRDWILYPIQEPVTSSKNEVFLSEIRPAGLEYASTSAMNQKNQNRICVRPLFWIAKLPDGGTPANPQKTTKGAQERLKVLKELLEKRLITREEYERKKAEILKDL
ncbi:putative lipoprotein [Leptospira inadai serovar Lyme str. 10]|uniref:SHOCT domain-containing protein n=2 Tax=Leptospira inadai serovar Lyme TaxID=293084 RepID=A0ABX4YJG9_9LEPT|nr:putative lipoprotein [Leptospira inadai serovar Lyme str. 10]PNV75396.1 SHOCT domain-containing protein [Leptospira inadai serovar Lyme]